MRYFPVLLIINIQKFKQEINETKNIKKKL